MTKDTKIMFVSVVDLHYSTALFKKMQSVFVDDICTEVGELLKPKENGSNIYNFKKCRNGDNNFK